MSGQLAARFGPRLPASAGLLLAGMTGLGFLQLGLATEPMVLWLLFFAWGSGLGLATGALTNAAVSELPQTRAGMGASVLAAMRQIGTALGVALLGALITIVLAGSLPAALQSLPIAPEQQSELAAQIVREGLGTAIMVAGIPTTELQQLVRVTYLNGLRVAAVVAAAGLLTASLLAAYFMVGVIRRPAEASAGQAPVGVTPKS